MLETVPRGELTRYTAFELTHMQRAAINSKLEEKASHLKLILPPEMKAGVGQMSSDPQDISDLRDQLRSTIGLREHYKDYARLRASEMRHLAPVAGSTPGLNATSAWQTCRELAVRKGAAGALARMQSRPLPPIDVGVRSRYAYGTPIEVVAYS